MQSSESNHPDPVGFEDGRLLHRRAGFTTKAASDWTYYSIGVIGGMLKRHQFGKPNRPSERPDICVHLP